MIAIGFVTCANPDEARKIALALLEKKLVACANILNPVESHYRWNGKIEHATETLLILKTNSNKIISVIPEIQKNHSYQLPAIEFVQADYSPIKYEQFVNAQTK